ncbi:hypothetical protein MYSEV_299 [Mythimna separata entomopoxvirus 'L']|uniref:Uncharacterized protein n=1 Tax=Mythimna separata entomopoxvirus 'L' TaxID=1293572 RepID=A0A916KQH3_9POXV|nr:hypothetical protein MYSEV_299 [Mythimna separata entomopoxvirus 'L']CCU56497.1 hypothetical protein MYSEV_299 [Mythimna separata entomopoxvirus 'L']
MSHTLYNGINFVEYNAEQYKALRRNYHPDVEYMKFHLDNIARHKQTGDMDNLKKRLNFIEKSKYFYSRSKL